MEDRLGLIVPVTRENLAALQDHANFACGLLPDDEVEAKWLAAALAEMNLASLEFFGGSQNQAVQTDAVILKAQGFSDAFKRLNGKADAAAFAKSRHEAMELAEQGADLLIFKGTLQSGVEDCAWWQEIMALPCALDLRAADDLQPHIAALSNDFMADFWLVDFEQIDGLDFRHDLKSL